ncbi:MAG: AI-2E family transporter [Deltaproteobacteria bacterium]|nr:AI-2E family transporter [Candidatus Anaeroferrophillus wilburensis]MBN2889696.1 AI-2E family transporter [Deltaproteobacteria bacterium]
MPEHQGQKPYVFSIIFLFSMLLLLWTIYPFLYTIIFSLMLVGVSYPGYLWLMKVTSGRMHISSLMICLGIFLGIFLPLVFLITTLSVEVADFYAYLRQSLTVESISSLMDHNSVWVERLKSVLDRLDISYNLSDVEEHVVQLGKTLGLVMYEQTRNLAGKVMHVTLHFVIMIVIIYYLLIDGLRLKEYVLTLLPLPRDQENLLLSKFNDMAIAIVIGNGVAAILQGILGGFGLTMFEMRSPVLWGTVMGIFAFIPFIGISVVFIPITIYLLISGQVTKGLLFFSYFAVLSGVVEYLFKPKLVGNRVKMHVLLVFVSIFGGIATFGILGILFGPLVAIAFLTLAEMYLAAMGKDVQ